jgi:multidrug efflux pump subunit AcrA (membrane-fusion protein)
MLGSLGFSSCVTLGEHEELSRERDQHKEQAELVGDMKQQLAELELDNQNANDAARKALYEVEQLIVTNRTLLANYQDLVTRVQEYEAIYSGDPNANLQEALQAHQGALEQKEYQIRQLQQQAQMSQQRTRGGSGSFGAPSSEDISCQIIQQDGSAMMIQLRNLHFALAQAISRNASSQSQVELSEPSTNLTLSFDVSWLLEPGQAKLSENGRNGMARFAEILRPYNQLNVYIEAYPSSNILQAWEQSGITSALIAKELNLNGIPAEILFPVGKGYPKPDAYGKSPAGKVRFVFKPQYEVLHQKVISSRNASGNLGQ